MHQLHGCGLMMSDVAAACRPCVADAGRGWAVQGVHCEAAPCRCSMAARAARGCRAAAVREAFDGGLRPCSDVL